MLLLRESEGRTGGMTELVRVMAADRSLFLGG
jgi:hypothetical protein